MPWKPTPNGGTQQQLLEGPRGETRVLADPDIPCSLPAPQQLQKSDLLREKLITTRRMATQAAAPWWGRDVLGLHSPGDTRVSIGVMCRTLGGCAPRVLSALHNSPLFSSLIPLCVTN